jgi:hypothetical protein
VRAEAPLGRWAPRTLAAAEFARVETYVYGHALARNRYDNEGVGLGDPLGPDADRLAGSAVCDVTANATIGLAAAHERHGAQRIGTPQDARNPRGEPFPSRPFASVTTVELAASWRPRVTRRLDARLAYTDDSGARCGWSGELAITVRFDRAFAAP